MKSTVQHLFHIAPLAPAVCGLMLGVIFREAGLFPLPVALALLLMGLGIALRFRRSDWLWWLMIPLTSLAAGSLIHARVSILPLNDIAHLATNQHQLVRVQGVVTSPPRLQPPPQHTFAPWTFGRERTAFLMQIKAIETVGGFEQAQGLLRVRIDEPLLDLHLHDPIEVFGWLYQIQSPSNPGGFDWSAYYRYRGIRAALHGQHRECVKLMTPDQMTPSSLRQRLRTRVRRMLLPELPTSQEAESLMEALILGQRSQLSRHLNDIFIQAGCIHFLAVSGLHVAIPMMFVWWLGRWLRFNSKWCAVFMLLVLLAYVLIAESRPPILRAALIGLMYCVSIFVGRPRSTLNWLSAAGIILILASPLTIFDVGFQLSFASVLGIVFLPPILSNGAAHGRAWLEVNLLDRPYGDSDRALMKAAKRLNPEVGLRRALWLFGSFVRRHVFTMLLMSMAAWIVAMPIVAYHFSQLHLWSPVSSLLVFPFIFALVILGFAQLVVESLLPGYGVYLSELFSLLDGLLISMVKVLAGLPGSTITVGAPAWWWITAWYLFWLVFYMRFRKISVMAEPNSVDPSLNLTCAKPMATWMKITSISCLLVMMGGWLPSRTSSSLRMTVLSVGAGSAIVLELPHGETIIIDAGSSSPFDVGKHTVIPFLRARGIDKIERLYLTHPNLDHFSALPTILDEMSVGVIMVNQYFAPHSAPRSPSRHLLNWLEKSGHAVETMNESHPPWSVSGVTFEWLWPKGTYDDTLSTNDTSTLLRITYAGRSILLTGDIEDRPQRSLLEQSNLKADVLVLPHHGSVRPSTADFLNAVNADILIRTSRETRAKTMSNLYELIGEATIFNTADHGAVTIVLTQQGIQVQTAR